MAYKGHLVKKSSFKGLFESKDAYTYTGYVKMRSFLLFIPVKNFPQFEELGVRGSEIDNYNFDVRGGIQQGYQQEKEMTNEIKRRGIKAPTRGSAAFGHGQLNKRAPGIKELDELARISYLANSQFAKGLFNQILYQSMYN